MLTSKWSCNADQVHLFKENQQGQGCNHCSSHLSQLSRRSSGLDLQHCSCVPAEHQRRGHGSPTGPQVRRGSASSMGQAARRSISGHQTSSVSQSSDCCAYLSRAGPHNVCRVHQGTLLPVRDSPDSSPSAKRRCVEIDLTNSPTSSLLLPKQKAISVPKAELMGLTEDGVNKHNVASARSCTRPTSVLKTDVCTQRTHSEVATETTLLLRTSLACPSSQSGQALRGCLARKQ